MKKEYVVITVIGLLIASGAFFAGMKYQQTAQSATAGKFVQGNAQAGARGTRTGQQGATQGNGQGMGQGFRPVNGEVLSKDEKSITVKMVDGSSKIVMLSSTATISKSSAGSVDDLKVGEKVMIFGSTNTDGSVTAQSIQLNPPMAGSGSARMK